MIKSTVILTFIVQIYFLPADRSVVTRHVLIFGEGGCCEIVEERNVGKLLLSVILLFPTVFPSCHYHLIVTQDISFYR